jgi:hypothetical protein
MECLSAERKDVYSIIHPPYPDGSFAFTDKYKIEMFDQLQARLYGQKESKTGAADLDCASYASLVKERMRAYVDDSGAIAIPVSVDFALFEERMLASAADSLGARGPSGESLHHIPDAQLGMGGQKGTSFTDRLVERGLATREGANTVFTGRPKMIGVRDAIIQASAQAGRADAGWNRRFVDSLEDRGYTLIPTSTEGPNGGWPWCPVPVEMGWRFSYPSLVIPAGWLADEPTRPGSAAPDRKP